MDTDIFTATTAGAVPNVLIVLDNTASYDNNKQHFPGMPQGQAELDAIRTVINSLSGSVNVGLMEFVTAPGAGSGGYVRFAISPMGSDQATGPVGKANFSAVLTTQFNNFRSTNEKAASSQQDYGNLMLDAYNYFSGNKPYAPSGDVVSSLADFNGYVNPGTACNAWTATTSYALNAVVNYQGTNYTCIKAHTASTLLTPPLSPTLWTTGGVCSAMTYNKFKAPLSSSDICAHNYIIFIGNPEPQGSVGDNAANTTALSTAGGNTSQLPLQKYTAKSVPTASFIQNTDLCSSAIPTGDPTIAVCPSDTNLTSPYDSCAYGTDSSTTMNDCTGTDKRYVLTKTVAAHPSTPTTLPPGTVTGTTSACYYSASDINTSSDHGSVTCPSAVVNGDGSTNTYVCSDPYSVGAIASNCTPATVDTHTATTSSCYLSASAVNTSTDTGGLSCPAHATCSYAVGAASSNCSSANTVTTAPTTSCYYPGAVSSTDHGTLSCPSGYTCSYSIGAIDTQCPGTNLTTSGPTTACYTATSSIDTSSDHGSLSCPSGYTCSYAVGSTASSCSAVTTTNTSPTTSCYAAGSVSTSDHGSLSCPAGSTCSYSTGGVASNCTTPDPVTTTSPTSSCYVSGSVSSSDHGTLSCPSGYTCSYSIGSVASACAGTVTSSAPSTSCYASSGAVNTTTDKGGLTCPTGSTCSYAVSSSAASSCAAQTADTSATSTSCYASSSAVNTATDKGGLTCPSGATCTYAVSSTPASSCAGTTSSAPTTSCYGSSGVVNTGTDKGGLTCPTGATCTYAVSTTAASACSATTTTGTTAYLSSAPAATAADAGAKAGLSCPTGSTCTYTVTAATTATGGGTFTHDTTQSGNTGGDGCYSGVGTGSGQWNINTTTDFGGLVCPANNTCTYSGALENNAGGCSGSGIRHVLVTEVATPMKTYTVVQSEAKNTYTVTQTASSNKYTITQTASTAVNKYTITQTASTNKFTITQSAVGPTTDRYTVTQTVSTPASKYTVTQTAVPDPTAHYTITQTAVPPGQSHYTITQTVNTPSTDKYTISLPYTGTSSYTIPATTTTISAPSTCEAAPANPDCTPDTCAYVEAPKSSGHYVCPSGTSVYAIQGFNEVITEVPTKPAVYATDTKPWNADEWARFMYQIGMPVADTTVKASASTYTIDVYHDKPDAYQTSVLASMATNGGGGYFSATNESAIITALKTVFSEIQSVNSTFASAALPISATQRSQNDNQVYIGMFRPDQAFLPRWYGNVKRYQLGIVDGGATDLVDSTGAPAVNPGTGFITPCAQSFWSTDSNNYWANVSSSTYGPRVYFTAATSAGTAWATKGDDLKLSKSDCQKSTTNLYSDAPDGPTVEKGGAAEMLRKASSGSRKMLTLGGETVVPFNSTTVVSADSVVNANIINFISGQDVTGEIDGTPSSSWRPSIHGDVVHSQPLPVDYGDALGGVRIYYGSNDGTYRAIKADTGAEQWAFVAPESFPYLQRLLDNGPLVQTPSPTPPGSTDSGGIAKNYFFDGSTGLYQAKGSSDVWIYPTMRRGGRRVYAFNVTDPATTPTLLWRKGCPDLTDDVGCDSADLANIGQTWSTPNAVFLNASSTATTKLVVVMGGGYDTCEDADSNPSASGFCSSPKGAGVYVFDGQSGEVIKYFALPGSGHSVAAEVALVDVNFDGKVDLAYVADTGGNIYRINFSNPSAGFAPLTSAYWTITRVAYTNGSSRKFLFAPALLPLKGQVYLAIASGDREHPTAKSYSYTMPVINRAYVYLDDPTSTTVTNLDDTTVMLNNTDTNTCNSPGVLPGGTPKGWFVDLTQNGRGEQAVTSAIINGGLVAFSTNRPVTSDSTCTNVLGKAYGYWMNLLNGSGAISVGTATCGGSRSSEFVGGGLPPSPVTGVVNIKDSNGNGVAENVVIGAVKRDGSASSPVGGQNGNPGITQQRSRIYWHTTTDTH